MRDWGKGFYIWLTSGFRAAPRLAVLALLLRLSTTVCAPLQAYGVKLLVDGLIGHDSTPLVSGATLLVATLAVTLLTLAFDDAVFQTMLDHVHTHLNHGVIRTIAGIPGVEHHERPDIADRIELLRTEGRLLTFSFTYLLSVTAAFTNAAVVLWLLAGVHPILLALPLLSLLRVWTAYINGRYQWNAKESTAQHTRRAGLLADIAKSPRNALEVRVFGLRNALLQQIDSHLRDAEVERLRASRRGAFHEIGARVVFGAAYGCAIVFVALRARSGYLSPGDLALVVLLGARVEQTAAGIAEATRNTGDAIRMLGVYASLQRYAKENSWSDSRAAAPGRLQHGISLHNVGFHYPGTSTPVLSDINLELPSASTVALVGDNGAGKTTLVKLLARLYDPSAGAILVDGQDLRSIDAADWRTHISAAFQDSVRYELTAGQSVGVGDLPRLDDEGAILKAVARGDATTVVDGLPNGLRTQLGRRFALGVDLSGGQWQRLALSRALMRTQPLLLVLDEPTAALDSEAESALFDRYARASAKAADRTGGITVLVSHRFSTVRMADLIVVMNEGRIVETGSHETLLAQNGLYAELFTLQAHAYQTS